MRIVNGCPTGRAMGDLGKEKLARVKKNSDYFRDSLIAMYVVPPCVN